MSQPCRYRLLLCRLRLANKQYAFLVSDARLWCRPARFWIFHYEEPFEKTENTKIALRDVRFYRVRRGATGAMATRP